MDSNGLFKPLYGIDFSIDDLYRHLMDPSMPVASEFASNFPNPSPIPSMDYNQQTSSLPGANAMATTANIGHHGQMQPDNTISWVSPVAPFMTYQNPLIKQGLSFNEGNGDFFDMGRRCVSLKNTATGGDTLVNYVIKGQWTAEEDELLKKAVEEIGVKKWSSIARKLNGRMGKQCRERWFNHLRPNIKKDNWSEEEDKFLIKVHKKIGNKWAKISKYLPGRTENSIKNHWNATKRRQSTRKINCRNPNDHLHPSPLLQNYIQGLPIPDEELEPSSDIVVANVNPPAFEPECSSIIAAGSDDTINVSCMQEGSSSACNLDMVNRFLEENDESSNNDLVVEGSGWDAILAFENEIADAAFGDSANAVVSADADSTNAAAAFAGLNFTNIAVAADDNDNAPSANYSAAASAAAAFDFDHLDDPSMALMPYENLESDFDLIEGLSQHPNYLDYSDDYIFDYVPPYNGGRT